MKFAMDKAPEYKFYKTDHHWTYQFAFDVFVDIANNLKQNYNVQFDEDILQKSNYDFIPLFEFLGSGGVRTGKAYPNYMDTEYLLNYLKPNTNFEAEFGVLKNSFTPLQHQGDINQLFNIPLKKYEQISSTIIKNNSQKVNTKAVVFIDSFSNYLQKQYSLLFKEVLFIDLRVFRKDDLWERIKNFDPDIVIAQYSAFTLDKEGALIERPR